MGLFDILSGPVSALVGAVGGIIDDLSTSDEEKLQAKIALAKLETDFQRDVIKADAAIAAEQASIIRTEATSESWLTRTWRPITMLSFVLLLFLYWFDVAPDGISDDVLLEVFGIVKIGIGGYVVSRGVEKSVVAFKAE